MQEKNKLVEEAFIQMKQVEEAIAENAKGILASTMKEEINQLVKESLSEQSDDEVDADAEIETDVKPDGDTEVDMTVDNPEDEDIDFDVESEELPIDLTNASDEEILKVFKAMGEEDGIIVKKDGDNVHLMDNDADVEYLVKLGESESKKKTIKEMRNEKTEAIDDVIDAIFANKDTDEVDLMDVKDFDTEEMGNSMEEEVVYEIQFDEDDEDAMDETHHGMMDEDDEDAMDETHDEDAMDETHHGMMDEDDEDAMDETHDEDAMDETHHGMMDEDDEDAMDEDDKMCEDDEDAMDETHDGDMDESLEEAYDHKKVKKSETKEGKNMTVKPKGTGIGHGPKFSYKDKVTGGFKEDKKEGPKTMGTGKAKFEYKKGENMEGKSKVVKAETKEGQGYKDKEDERLSMKHGKIASKHLKTTKARRDDAGFEKRETHEAARTYGMGSKEGRGLRKGITNNRNYVYGNNGVKVESLESEVSMLREKNEEYRKALNIFREKLNEVAIFNSNLAYATRLFTEHSTTKKEKINILRRFDDVETLKESKNLYKSLKDELGGRESKSINESVAPKLDKTVSTGSSTSLIESKTYENPQFIRMRDLMSKLG